MFIARRDNLESRLSSLNTVIPVFRLFVQDTQEAAEVLSTCRGCGLSDAENAFTISPTDVPHESDYSPSTSKSAREVVKEGKTKLADLEAAIERLRKHQKALRSTIAHYRAFLAPISRIPQDVLLLIFTTVVGGTRGSLWRIAAMCRGWRRSALSCAPLWANIQLDFSSTSLPDVLLQYSRARTRLLRAGPHTPLTYTLNISNERRFWGYDTEFRVCVEDAASRLVGHMHRCSRIDVSGYGHEDWDVVKIQYPTRTFPTSHLLHTLKISHDYWFRSGLFQETRALKHLTLSRVRLDAPQVYPRLQNVRFPELGHCDTTAIQLFEFLRAAQELKILLLRPFRPFEVPRGTPSLHLPSVRTLDISFASGEESDGDTLPAVVAHLRTP